jgi:FtsP/CotA-like multicopper oxidase with cupredoxin domain
MMNNNSITIHMHGLVQKGTPFSDGVGGVSQTAIKPGESHTVTTNTAIGDAGTYLYHAHTADLLVTEGPLIIDSAKLPSSFKYDDERTVFIQDWWHNSSDVQLKNLLQKDMIWIGGAQSLLFNGKGRFQNCTMAETNSKTPKYNSDYAVVNVTAGKTYRFRFIGALALHAIFLVVPDHQMTLIEVDGTFIVPVTVDFLEISPGQRYSGYFIYTCAENLWNCGINRFFIHSFDYNESKAGRLLGKFTSSMEHQSQTSRKFHNSIRRNTTPQNNPSYSTPKPENRTRHLGRSKL